MLRILLFRLTHKSGEVEVKKIIREILSMWALVLYFGLSFGVGTAESADRQKNSVKLIFIHHSCGENWLADENGGLAHELEKNHYFVSDSNYGWGMDSIGDRTDIINWPEWFVEEGSPKILNALYRETGVHSPYRRKIGDPGGENEIIMFKSCFPNSNLEGDPKDLPSSGMDGEQTIANSKGVYNRLLKYFAVRPDKLFIAVTAPPVTDSRCAKNARAFNLWLVHDWLRNYPPKNVAVFDLFNVLTGKDNHHRVKNGKIEHVYSTGRNTLYYPAGSGDDHPSAEGNRKATVDFISLLNHYHGEWRASKPEPLRTSQSLPEPHNRRDAREKTPEKKVVVPEVATDKNIGKKYDHTPAADNMIDDFEEGLTGWEVFKDDSKSGTSLGFALNKSDKAGGIGSLSIQYHLPPQSWATCAKVFSESRSLKSWNGISFKVKGGGDFHVFLYEKEQNGDGLLIFERKLRHVDRKPDVWTEIRTPWKEFRQPEWQGDPSVTFKPEEAKGLAFHFTSTTEGEKGEVHIDDVMLFK